MAITLDDGEVVTAAEHAASVISGTGKTDYWGVTKIISVRMPLHISNRLQALAHRSGKSRNATICNFLAVAIEEVEKHLSEEVVREVNELENEVIAGSLAEQN
jgi:predicted DNA-binding protein